MCLYEPINGDYPTVRFCDMHPDCAVCLYHYEWEEDHYEWEEDHYEWEEENDDA